MSISLPVSADDSEDVRFEVMWQTDNIGGCSGVSHANSTSVTNGSASYVILRLEEDSCYSITVTVSSPKAAEISDRVNVTIKTLGAGKLYDNQIKSQSCLQFLQFLPL